MSRANDQKQSADFDRARDELFSHIHRCGVLSATAEQQKEWIHETVEYIGERYPDLSPEALEQIRAIGLRFCSPVIEYGAEDAAEESNAGPEATGVVAA